jgi:hypothetical protein
MSDEIPAEPFLFRLTVEHTPSPDDPKGADEFYRAIGIMIVAWGRLEGHFVATLLTMMTIAPSAFGTKLPMDWKARAAMWRKTFDIVPDLSMFKMSALHFLEKMESVALDRHAIVHSLWEKFSDTAPLSIGAVLIRAKNKTLDGLDIKRGQISVEDVIEVAQRTNELNLRLMPMSQFLVGYRNAQKPPPANIRII